MSSIHDNMKRRVRSITHNTQNEIAFVDAVKGPDDLIVIFCRRRFYEHLTWEEYKAIGEPAITATVRSGWSCMEMDRLGESIRQGKFNKSELDRLREEAKDKHRWISTREHSEPVSVFD
ncbi:uncharacterized protein ASPGLDRAFT_173941 [Aspergillus glaucus CBS 516.65]|uniref:Uncharacterized protein n=1 Tax=Aspergillus glaucus CBS 516.65 TaxID=1160497 RepID=A0A1L9VH65_ASPGL|nr:hypothetical protein ASPGLDRAFT_173941 [Aspergillus glaucus CBS 516.65]OJJ83278.1 hypothetical protein ASPGLDRAFT_173941 [Aspergillus glaucus CBS 516.65]